MTGEQGLREFRRQIRRLSELAGDARQLAIALTEEGHPAENVRSHLYAARQSLDRAAKAVSNDLMNGATPSPDQQYERDLS